MKRQKITRIISIIVIVLVLAAYALMKIFGVNLPHVGGAASPSYPQPSVESLDREAGQE